MHYFGHPWFSNKHYLINKQIQYGELEDMSIKRTKRRAISYKDGGISGVANRSWYRGESCNFNPNKDNLLESDAIEKYILKGWTPESPILGKKDVITTFGSCFATHISKYLDDRGYNSAPEEGVVSFRAGVNNTFAIRQLIDWTYNDKEFLEETWHKSDRTIIKRNDKIRKKTLKRFGDTSIFVITLGLSEIWYNKRTNDVFWRAIPEENFDKNIHGFRVSSFGENKENISFIYNQIIKNNPNAKVIFTVSPVPLVATFRDVSCMSANSVSKSILRGAVDEVYRELPGHAGKSLFYWPSYEIVEKIFPLTIGGNKAEDGRGPYLRDNRHIKDKCVQEIMSLFEKYYVK
jgi:hypothetical protein